MPLNLQCSRLVQEEWVSHLRRDLNKHLDRVLDFKRQHPYAIASCIEVVRSVLAKALEEPWNMKYRKVSHHYKAMS